MLKRVLVTGCPRSGNTLMGYMLKFCMANVRHVKGEVYPKAKFGLPKVPWLVTKRPEEFYRVKKALNEGTRVIYMLRDPRAVISSIHFSNPKGFYVKPETWCDAAEALLEVVDKPNLFVVRFEKLVINPNQVQQQIAEAL